MSLTPTFIIEPSFDLTLSGAVSEEEYENRHEILEEILSRFLEQQYRDSGLTRQITRELIRREFPETSFCAVLLTALLDEPREAQLLYDLLNEKKENAK